MVHFSFVCMSSFLCITSFYRRNHPIFGWHPFRVDVSGYAVRLDSSDRSERLCRGKGASTEETLSEADYQQIQTLWADHYPVYHELHRKYNRSNSRHRIRPPDIAHWQPRGNGNFLSSEEQQWQQMTNTIKVRSLFVYLLTCRCLIFVMWYIGILTSGVFWSGLPHTRITKGPQA